ncbi:MAG: SDR family NAD(P)-dependent oxidoreductase [Ottowia sp.]|nr:SDR family oxidoreductase [Ottowia sp.]
MAKRTAVVTGAASPRGIGVAAARQFAAAGWAVVLVDRDLQGANAAAADINRTAGVQALAVPCDVTNEASVQQAAQRVRQEADLPTVGALANIAGVPEPATFSELSLEKWNRVLAVNLTGTFLMCKAFVPQMMAQRYGRIVNMSSITAFTGGGIFSKSAYAAAKAGIVGFTRGLARDLAPYAITANAVAPGVVDTDIRMGTTDEIEHSLSGAVPLGRQASAAEIAALFVWLCSENAGYITGTTQHINGGSYFG